MSWECSETHVLSRLVSWNNENGTESIRTQVISYTGQFVLILINSYSSHYAPNFEEVDGAYWFKVVHPFIKNHAY